VIEARVSVAYKTIANHTFICPYCGTQWAKLTAHPGRSWIIHTRCCTGCKSPWPEEVPGLLMDRVEALCNDGHGCAHLPQTLLVREFELLAGIDKPTEQRHNHPTLTNPMQAPMSDLTSRIAELRSKIASNTVTDAELREGIAFLRGERTSASVRRTETKAKAAPVDGGALLAKLAAMAQAKPQ
jgi:hypothetical protein